MKELFFDSYNNEVWIESDDGVYLSEEYQELVEKHIRFRDIRVNKLRKAMKTKQGDPVVERDNINNKIKINPTEYTDRVNYGGVIDYS